MGKTESLTAVLIVWSVRYVLAKDLKREGNIESFRFYGQMAWAVISLIHPKDELPFKEIRMQGQSAISSSCICNWCESREIGGKGSPILSTSMVESFSPDLLPAIKSYWTEPSFELCILLDEHDAKLLHIMSLLLEWGDKIELFCACVAERVFLLLSALLYILLWLWCVKEWAK